jgi:phosphoheptose isomerase
MRGTNDLFVKTVRETGKKSLIMAGVWTNVNYLAVMESFQKAKDVASATISSQR